MREKYIKFRNTGTKKPDGKVSKDTVRVEVEGATLEIPFGAEVEIPEHYTKPRRAQNGSRLPSPIEQLAPQLEPTDEGWKATWMLPPAEEVKRPQGRAFSVDELVRSGIPRGVAETLVAAANAARNEAMLSAEKA